VSCTYYSTPVSTTSALLRSATYGRSGKGTIFVFASGNDAALGEDVNADRGECNSIYTITVGATSGDGKISSYSTPGAAVHVSAPGGDFDQSYQMWTTGTMQQCKNGGAGTSFAAPVVSGVIALMLQANPDLNWRDVQDILARTSTKLQPEDRSWTTNSGGLSHSYKYGFGRVDAYSAVVASTQQISTTQGSCTLMTHGEALQIPDG
jgi:subtilisin family serine protease